MGAVFGSLAGPALDALAGPIIKEIFGGKKQQLRHRRYA